MKFLNLLIVLFLFYKLGDSSSSSCEELHNITYPYPLPTNCSGKAFELVCDGNNTVLYNAPAKYLVKDISIENKTFRLVDPDFAVGSCHLPSQTLSSDEYCALITSNIECSYNSSLLYFLASSSLIYFYNCTEEVENSMYKQIHCMDGTHSRVYAVQSSRAYLGIFFYDKEIGVGSAPKSCRFVGSTVADFLVENRWKDIDGVQVMEMLRRGFVVSWNTTELSPPQFRVWNMSNSDIVKYCWNSTKSIFNSTMRDPDLSTWYKLLEPLFVQLQFLYCTYQPQEFSYSFDLQQEQEFPDIATRMYTSSSHVVFGFMLVLLPLLDILLVLIGIRLTLLPLAIFSFLFHKYKRVSLSINFVEKFLRNHEILSVRRYDFIEITTMTNNFREKLGQGGFGSVYKGKLFSGCQVAVKILTNPSGDGNDFISEVATIGRIHHTNIVRLIGFCSEGSKWALVYPYMPKGSLDKYIFSSSNNSFSIEIRREIALGIARGIDYLHRGCQMQILHFDIKPHNILLDHDLTLKISDFGLAKLYSREYNLVTLSTARGTIGYIAPELISRVFGVISYKADVYSFGMLLMEMVSGRRNVDNHAESSSQVYYPSWIYDQLKLADETRNYDLNNCVAHFGETEGILYKVALWCIQSRASNRPSMSRVLEMLHSDVDSLEMPPKPFTTCSVPDEVSMRCSQIDSCSIELSAISEEISLL